MASIKKNAFFNVIRSIFSILFPLISFPYASRVLLPEGIGNINFVNSFIDVLLLVEGLGIKTYAIREGAKIRDDKNELNKLARELLLFNVLSMLVCLIVFIIALFFIPTFVNLRLLLLITGSKLLFETFNLDWVLNVKEDYQTITIRTIILQLITLIFLFVFVHEESDLWKYAIMGIIYSAGQSLFTLSYSRKYINLFSKTKISLKKHYKSIFIFFGTVVCGKLLNVIDSLMLGFLCKPEQVGYYSAALKLISMIVSITGAVLTVLLPRCTAYYHNKNLEEYAKMVHYSINATLFFTIPATFGLMVLCKPLILIFSGIKFIEASPVMLILCPTMIMNGIITAAYNLILLPQSKEKHIFISQAISGIVNLILNIPCIIYWQAIGAAISTLVSQIIVLIYQLILSKDYLLNKSVIINTIQTLIASLVMYFVVNSLVYFQFSPIIQTIIGITLGCFTYAIIILLFKNAIAISVISFVKSKLNIK